jgi:hypothetical protein
MEYSFKKEVMQEKIYGENVIRIPFEISGNHDHYICFNDKSHVRIISYIEKKNQNYDRDCAAYDSEVYHYGYSHRYHTVPKTFDIWRSENLLGWNENGHWGDRYYHEDGTDKTEELYDLITSNNPADIAAGLISDLKHLIYDINQVAN